MAWLLADLGGTNLKIGLCSEEGKMLGPVKSVPTKAQLQPEALIDYWASELWREAGAVRPNGLLMGIPSKEEDGLLLPCNNLPTLGGYPLRALLTERMGIPVQLYPDAVCYAMGAYHRYGGSRKNVLVITLGTGVGAAWILNGKLYQGNGMTGEMWIAPYQDGILEDVLSTAGLLARGAATSPKELARQAQAGDAKACAAFAEYGRALGTLLCYAVGMMDPECVLIGGGIAKGHKCFEAVVQQLLDKHTVRRSVPMLYCDGDDGALALFGAYLLGKASVSK